MTDTKPDLIDRAQEAPPRRRSRMWLWILVAVAVAAGALSAALLWPDGDDSPAVLSVNPPHGLTEIDMPRTEAELASVLERMPAIDGRRPTVTRHEGLITVDYERSGLPEDYSSIVVGLDLEVGSDWFIDGLQQEIVDAETEGRIVEASDLDPDDDLVWLVDHEAGGGNPVFRMMWADPSDLGPAYSVFSDTADFRLKLVHAFVSTVDG